MRTNWPENFSSARRALLIAATAAFSLGWASAQAAPITVNSLVDDVFPDATGAIFDAGGAPVVLTAPKCTLRMAIVAANLDFAVGGGNGCAQGSGPDAIDFAPALTAAAPAVLVLDGSKRTQVPLPLINNIALLRITAPLTITGPTANRISVSGSGSRHLGSYRPLWISDGGDNTLIDVSISNLTLRDGRAVTQFDQSVTPTAVSGAGGGCLLNFENLTLTDVTFDNCTSQGASEPGVPTNYSSGSGGALWVGAASTTATARPSVTLTRVLARNSQALHSTTPYSVPASALNYFSTGGCMVLGGRIVNVITLDDVLVENCEADSNAGLLTNNANSVSLNKVSAVRNRAVGTASNDTNIDSGYNGGMSLRSSGSAAVPTGTITANDVEVLFNHANSDRGGLEVRNTASFTGSNLSVAFNEARSIGGMDIRDVGAATVTGALITHNHADQAFGGLRARLGGASRTLTLDRIAVVGNDATGTVATAAGAGGVQFDTDGVYRLINSTVAFNRVGPGYFGGGVKVNMHSTTVNGIDVLVSNSTSARNEADGGEGLEAFTANATPLTNGRIVVRSSILGNRSGTASQNTVSAGANEAAKITYSNTLVEGPNPGVANQALVCVAGVICGPNARLMPLVAANERPFATALLPMAGSPALGAGSNVLSLTQDQRGLTRVVSGIDMGSIEAQVGELVAASCSLDMDGDTQVSATKEGLVLLRAMLGFSGANAVIGTTITQSQWDATRNNLNANCGTNF